MQHRRKDSPLAMRFAEADITVIDRAASLRGRSRSDFIRDAAVAAAEQTLLEQSVIRLEPEAFAAFQAALSAPVTAMPKIREIMQRLPPWEQPDNTQES